MKAINLKAHFDGEKILLDEPFNRLSENAAYRFPSFSHNNEGKSVAIVKLNDIIKRNEIFTAKPHRAVKSFL